MPENNSQLEGLRLRRQKLQQREREKALREQYGPALVRIVADALLVPLELSSFNPDIDSATAVDWPEDLRAAPGLVSAYISREVALEILGCIDSRLPLLSGLVGFHGKSYLGVAQVASVSATSLLEIAERAEDSVVFHTENPKGFLLVDFYRSNPGDPFSIVVQGDFLEAELLACFSANGNVVES